MTMLSAFICRIGGHKPYEFHRMLWVRNTYSDHLDGTMFIVKRCKRCGEVLAKRPASPDAEQIEA